MNTLTITDRLKLCALFQDLDEKELTKISDIAILKSFSKRTLLFFQNDPVQYIYILFKGKVKLYKSDFNGKECLLEIYKPGDIFPLENIFYKEKFSIYGEFIEDATVIVVPLSKFEQLIIQNKTLYINAYVKLSEQLFDLFDRLSEKILFSLSDQILLLLLRLSRKYGIILNNNWVALDIYISNKNLASMIGTSRETISRCLGELLQKNIIQYDTQHFLIINEKEIKTILHANNLLLKK